MDSLGVLVAHDFVSTRRYRSPSVAYPPIWRSTSITCCSCVYFLRAIILSIAFKESINGKNGIHLPNAIASSMPITQMIHINIIGLLMKMKTTKTTRMKGTPRRHAINMSASLSFFLVISLSCTWPCNFRAFSLSFFLVISLFCR